MATRTITANLTSPTYATLTDGDYIYYSTSPSDSGAVYNGKINSAYAVFTNFRVYSGSCYMSIYVGGEKIGETVEMDTDDFEKGSTTTVEVDLEYLEDAILTSSGEIEIHCYNNNSSTGDTYGVRSSGTVTIYVDYTEPSLTAPTNITVSQTSTHIKVGWSHATYTDGSATRKYYVIANNYDLWEGYKTLGTGYTGKSASIAIDDSWRGYPLNIWVVAYADDVPYEKWSSPAVSITPTVFGYIWYCNGNTWVQCVPYYGTGGTWKECIPYYGSGGVWKEVE